MNSRPALQRNTSRDHIALALDHLRRAECKFPMELQSILARDWTRHHRAAVGKLKSLLKLYSSKDPK